MALGVCGADHRFGRRQPMLRKGQMRGVFIHSVHGCEQMKGNLMMKRTALRVFLPLCLGVCRRTPNNFIDSVNCSLKIENSW